MGGRRTVYGLRQRRPAPRHLQIPGGGWYRKPRKVPLGVRRAAAGLSDSHRRNISWRRRISLAVSRTSLADSCHPRLSMSSALRSARAKPDSMSSSMVYNGGTTLLSDLRHSDTLATTEYERLVNEKLRLEKLYLQTVKNQEKALMEGERVKAAIRARLGEIDRRLTEIGGV